MMLETAKGRQPEAASLGAIPACQAGYKDGVI
jgi:hypothetical protein